MRAGLRRFQRAKGARHRPQSSRRQAAERRRKNTLPSVRRVPALAGPCGSHACGTVPAALALLLPARTAPACPWQRQSRASSSASPHGPWTASRGHACRGPRGASCGRQRAHPGAASRTQCHQSWTGTAGARPAWCGWTRNQEGTALPWCSTLSTATDKQATKRARRHQELPDPSGPGHFLPCCAPLFGRPPVLLCSPLACCTTAVWHKKQVNVAVQRVGAAHQIRPAARRSAPARLHQKNPPAPSCLPWCSWTDRTSSSWSRPASCSLPPSLRTMRCVSSSDSPRPRTQTWCVARRVFLCDSLRCCRLSRRLSAALSDLPGATTVVLSFAG